MQMDLFGKAMAVLWGDPMVLGQPASVLLCLLSAEAKHETGIRLNVVRTSVI